MNLTVHKISKIAAQVFGIFSSGYVISILMVNIFSPAPRVPIGRWSMLYLGEKLSIQLNMQSFKKDGEIVSMWLREDRLQSFTAARGVEGTTIFTKVSINCENNTVKFHEQLSFDSSLKFKQSNKIASEFDNPEDLMGLISTIIICQTPISEEENSVVVTPINRLTV
jgi:hypothetical protein